MTEYEWLHTIWFWLYAGIPAIGILVFLLWPRKRDNDRHQ